MPKMGAEFVGQVRVGFEQFVLDADFAEPLAVKILVQDAADPFIPRIHLLGFHAKSPCPETAISLPQLTWTLHDAAVGPISPNQSPQTRRGPSCSQDCNMHRASFSSPGCEGMRAQAFHDQAWPPSRKVQPRESCCPVNAHKRSIVRPARVRRLPACPHGSSQFQKAGIQTCGMVEFGQCTGHLDRSRLLEERKERYLGGTITVLPFLPASYCSQRHRSRPPLSGMWTPKPSERTGEPVRPNAFTDLQAALDVAQDGHEIWIANGRYRPSRSITSPNSNGPTFVLSKSITLYGGFQGGEQSLAQRDWKNNQSILSGDLSDNDPSDIFTDNATHVVMITAGAPVLDGLTITAGWAQGLWISNAWWGGGIYITGGNPSIRNCAVSANHATQSGAGIYCHTSAPGSLTITDSVFESNISGSDSSLYILGGALHLYDTPTTIERCVFRANVCPFLVSQRGYR